MTAAAEPLLPPRVLAETKRFAPLRSFSCGRQGAPWERAVNEWAKDLHRGAAADETVVLLEDAAHKLIGLCSIKPQPVVGGTSVGKRGQRIHMLGTDRLYRGQRLSDGSSPGDALLEAALEYIKTISDGSMPTVSALVAPENERAQALFDRHGFRRLPYGGAGEVIRLRPPGKRLSMVRLRMVQADLMAGRRDRAQASAVRSSMTGVLAVLVVTGILACGDQSQVTSKSKGAGARGRTTTAAASTTATGGANAPAGASAGPPQDDNHISTYGHAASGLERREIAALARNYLAAVVSHDGARACALMYSTLAETVPVNYGRPPGAPKWRGSTCAVVMSKIFADPREAQVRELRGVRVTGVRVRGRFGFVQTAALAMPAGELSIEREHGRWRIVTLVARPCSDCVAH